MAAPASASLKEYLKRYENSNEEDKKKKKKKRKPKTDVSGVVVVDEDPVWQKPVNLEEENDESDEEKPVVDEDIEVKRMKRLEQLRAKRPYGAISEDGSGWVSVSDTPKDVDGNDQNYDMSPPRRRRARNDTPSPDHSANPELETERVQNSDISPPRKRRARYDTPSPEPKLRSLESKGEDTDLSPPRQRQTHHHSPSFKTNKSRSPDLDADVSPPRRPRTHKRHEGRNSEVPDISPPRRGHSSFSNRNDSRASPGADHSPPRRTRKDRVESRDLPPRQSSRHPTEIDGSRVSSVSDFSPPRKSRKEASSASDLSPPRKSQKEASSVSDLSPPRKSRKEASSVKLQPKTGLITGKDVKEEIAKTDRDAWLRFKEMDPSMSGRGAEPVYRDKATGERISKEQLLKSTKKDEKPKEIKLEWGKGLAQKREAEAKLEELELEKDKPFARTRDDPELDKMLKERLRWGDPMAHLVKKKHPEYNLHDLGDNEKMKESGFIIPQDIPSHSWIKRGLDAAPNRYGIRPGRHWDGVDRSTGFEKTLFKRTNEKQATEREAYLWSVSDM